jgi:hypothetical protein
MWPKGVLLRKLRGEQISEKPCFKNFNFWLLPSLPFSSILGKSQAAEIVLLKGAMLKQTAGCRPDRSSDIFVSLTICY